MATRMPSAANTLAWPKPTPLPPPVMNATFPARCFIEGASSRSVPLVTLPTYSAAHNLQCTSKHSTFGCNELQATRCDTGGAGGLSDYPQAGTLDISAVESAAPLRAAVRDIRSMAR